MARIMPAGKAILLMMFVNGVVKVPGKRYPSSKWTRLDAAENQLPDDPAFVEQYTARNKWPGSRKLN